MWERTVFYSIRKDGQLIS